MRMIMITLIYTMVCWRAMAQSAPGVIVRELTDFNGTEYAVQLQYDHAGKPLQYFSEIFTPVCDDSVCRPVFIHLYWDLVGNYLKYEVPSGEVYTKIDHRDFDENDYQQLHDILSNTQSLLKDFRLDELVDTTTSRVSDSLDAITGATAKNLRNEVIDGALYTCYTLWHIANGRVTDSIRKVTDSLTTPDLLCDFLKSGNHHYQYYALDQVISDNEGIPPQFEQGVLQLLREKNVFLARNVLRRLPEQVFWEQDRQLWLWDTFLSANYSLKLDILRKMDLLPLKRPVLEQMAARQYSFNEEIANNIGKQLNKYK
jgi:hypothetical protein